MSTDYNAHSGHCVFADVDEVSQSLAYTMHQHLLCLYTHMHMPLLFAAFDRQSQGRSRKTLFEQKVGGLVYTFSSHVCRYKDHGMNL